MFRPFLFLAAALTTVFVIAGCAESVVSRPTTAEVARTCAGITDAQARKVFSDLRTDVDHIAAVRERMKTKPFVERPVGADVYIRATPGMTPQWLARLIRCHVVREECASWCASSECPLGLGGVTIDVLSTATGFIIALRSDDFDVAREIVRRTTVAFEPARAGHESGHAVLPETIGSNPTLANRNP